MLSLRPSRPSHYSSTFDTHISQHHLLYFSSSRTSFLAFPYPPNTYILRPRFFQHHLLLLPVPLHSFASFALRITNTSTSAILPSSSFHACFASLLPQRQHQHHLPLLQLFFTPSPHPPLASPTPAPYSLRLLFTLASLLPQRQHHLPLLQLFFTHSPYPPRASPTPAPARGAGRCKSRKGEKMRMKSLIVTPG